MAAGPISTPVGRQPYSVKTHRPSIYAKQAMVAIAMD